MFGKKRSGSMQKNSDNYADHMAKVIVRILQRMQELFVLLMNKAVNKMGTGTSKIVFAVVPVTTALFSFYLIGTALLQPKKGIQLLRPISVQQPTTVTTNEIGNVYRQFVPDTTTSTKLRQFILYFESIQKTQPKQYDSILQSRPGLIDSIRMLEQIYYLQQKNEAYEK